LTNTPRLKLSKAKIIGKDGLDSAKFLKVGRVNEKVVKSIQQGMKSERLLFSTTRRGTEEIDTRGGERE